MQSKPKSNSIVTHTIVNPDDTFDVTITLPKQLRYTVLETGQVEFDLTLVHPLNLAYSCLHGMGQRIPDGAAISMADKDGEIIPKAVRNVMKFNAMKRLINHYESGAEDWSLAGGGGGGGARSITIEAIARVFECEYEEAVEMVERHAEKKYAGNTKTALAKLRAEPKVQAAMLAIRQERLPKPVLDADSELDSLKAA